MADDELRNWFGDPFFQIAAAVPDCPLPAGPFIDEKEKRIQAHHRAERGTTCWLAKACDRPNSYLYDADIAGALQAALREREPFADTSLWVTVQGRVVYIEGCVAQEAQAAEIEALARAVPYVQQAIAIVRTEPSGRVPYRLRVPR
ncbi:MAG: BON domain-containing protein [Caldimonas sp.]